MADHDTLKFTSGLSAKLRQTSGTSAFFLEPAHHVPAAYLTWLLFKNL